MMTNFVKTLIKKFFRVLGFEIRKSDNWVLYQYLRQLDIDTVLDIGANTGQFASYISKLLPGVAIYSFEPLDRCYQELNKNMKGVEKFNAFPLALGDKDEKTEIFHNEFSPSSSILQMKNLHKKAFPNTKNTSSETIMVKELDSIADQMDLNGNVLIKIDVQGYEDKVIKGGSETIGKAIALIVETTFHPLYEGQVLFDGIHETLRGMGFIFVGAEEILRKPDDGTVLQSDAVFYRKDLFDKLNLI